MTHAEMSDDSLAVTSAGKFLVNVTHLSQRHELSRLAELAKATGRQVLVGVEPSPDEAREALAMLDDMSAEIVATVYRERG